MLQRFADIEKANLIAPMGFCAESDVALTPYPEASNMQYGLVEGWVARIA
jgi:hypothetical protein